MFLKPAPDYKTFLSAIPDGKPGVIQTLRVMSQVVKQYKKQPAIRNEALAILANANVRPKDFAGEVNALFYWVRDNIRYTMDVDDVETIYTPDVVLHNGAGDCDDQATLLATLLGAIGHPTRFVAVGFEPGTLSHVYTETLIGNTWVPLDPTEPHDVGWEPPGIVDSYEWHN